jgi:hypothetical protein
MKFRVSQADSTTVKLKNSACPNLGVKTIDSITDSVVLNL